MGRIFGRKKKEQVNMLSDGVQLMLEDSGQTENRIWTLLLKGIMVYCIVMGTVGSLLSSLDVDCNWWVIAIIIFLGALFCSSLYYSKRWENIGYILLFFLMLMVGITFRSYISSGVYAIANDLEEVATVFFDSNATQTFTEQVSNRRLAVTISMCYIGWVACMLVNVWISLHMRFLISGITSFLILSLSIYVDAIPNAFFVALLMTGLAGGYIFSNNGHFRPVHTNQTFEFVKTHRKKNEHSQITYVLAAKTGGIVLAAVFVLSFSVTMLMTVLYPQKYYQEHHRTTQLKTASMDTVENLTLMGIWAFFNYYPNTGGLTNGTLGGVNAVRLDYEPDLVVEFTPYTSERLYFKTFTGASYLPYTNRWSRLTNEDGQMLKEETDATVDKLIELYQSDSATGAQGLMKISNVAAYTGVYLPYYSQDTEQSLMPGMTKEYIYYPYFPQESLGLEETVDEAYLEVPEENLEAIEAFCEEAGLQPGDTQEVVQQLIAYYQENIPYTLRPGATRYNEDFINYFLEENQRGYCAHFASAATLIFRYLGIPARYVEGYAMDVSDMADEGTIEYKEAYSDYYDGYSPLGETNVMSVNLTDANAHAWVEIYDADMGWHVVEVTPSSSEEEVESGFWRMLMTMMGNDPSAESQTGNSTAGADEEDDILQSNTGLWAGRIVLGLLILLVVGLVIYRLVMLIRESYRYHRANRNEQLIIRYQQYIRRVGQRNRQIRRQFNYRMQLDWLEEHGYLTFDEGEKREWVRILEQAGFSHTLISEEEEQMILNRLKKINKND